MCWSYSRIVLKVCQRQGLTDIACNMNFGFRKYTADGLWEVHICSSHQKRDFEETSRYLWKRQKCIQSRRHSGLQSLPAAFWYSRQKLNTYLSVDNSTTHAMNGGLGSATTVFSNQTQPLSSSYGTWVIFAHWRRTLDPKCARDFWSIWKTLRPRSFLPSILW